MTSIRLRLADYMRAAVILSETSDLILPQWDLKNGSKIEIFLVFFCKACASNSTD